MSNSDKTVLVTGATGRQGGAVVRHLRPKGWKLRALTRNPNSYAAKQLAGQGVELVQGDLEDPASLQRAARGASIMWRSPRFHLRSGQTRQTAEQMKTKTIQQTITFKASPRQVYEMIMDSRKHSALSGERAKISRKVGGKFTAWGSHISGFNLALKPGKKIVQAWRATGWWPDHYSIAIFEIKKVGDGSKLKFSQIGIPPHRYSGHYRGWIEAYWTPMKEVFATGAISSQTRTRVLVDKEDRIDSGHFRRKISLGA